MITALDIRKFQTREEFLYYIYNNLGFDVEICYTYKKKDGSIGFSKWVKYSLLMHYEDNEWIDELRCTKKQFIDKATHRSILDIEFLLDIDEAGDFKDIKTHTRYIIKRLNYLGIKDFITYFTGSKSYHISIMVAQFRHLEYHKIEDIKDSILSFLGADLQKKAKRCMISLEGARHYKSGKKKEVVELDPY